MDVISRNHVTVIPGDGPTLLYAHGFGCNQEMWSEVIHPFEGRYRQVLFDYVGSGKSDITAFDRVKYGHLSGYSQDLVEVCDALNLTEDVICIAHSVSCSIAMLASIERPKLFRHMVLVGPNPCFVNDPPYIGGFERQDLEELLELLDRNFMGWADLLAPVASGDSESTEKRLHESFCSTDPNTTRYFAHATFFADNRDEVSRVKTPCLILQHRHDALAPQVVGEFMHRQLPNSELQILDVNGHCAHMSHPELVIRAVQSVLG